MYDCIGNLAIVLFYFVIKGKSTDLNVTRFHRSRSQDYVYYVETIDLSQDGTLNTSPLSLSYYVMLIIMLSRHVGNVVVERCLWTYLRIQLVINDTAEELTTSGKSRFSGYCFL